MKVIVVFFITAVWGFLGHLTRPYMIKNFTGNGRRFDGWFAILSYSLGILMTLVAFLVQLYLLIKKLLLNVQKPTIGDIMTVGFLAFILSFFPMGVGTVLGHWFLPDEV